MVFRRLAVSLSLAVLLAGADATAQDRVGKVSFPTSCSATVQQEFERAVAMLHSFWFSASVNAFTAVAQADPGCGIAHWGIAMNALGNPFAWPPSAKGLADGWAAVEKAKAAGAKTQRERDYIAAIEAFYKDAATVDHRTRALAYLQAMERLSQRYPDDREAAVFYSLALDATALPTDKTYANQLKAATILEKVFAEQPQHPGVAHYLIHSYDYPPIADKGLTAARRYAGIAPAAPHALHMPSHIFTRRGYWQDSIDSNRASAAVAADHFNQLHALDYLVYAHLQLGQDAAAKRVLDQVNEIQKINIEHFVSGFALATIPSRYALERSRWAEAASLTLFGKEFPWGRFPQSEAQLVFARALGAARSGNVTGARRDIDRLGVLRDALAAAKQGYWVEQVEIQRQIASAWVARAEGKKDEALALLRGAAEREDATEKHPVTPGPLVPARELLAEMLLDANEPAQALKEFEASMRVEPNRFKGLYGAARAAELGGDRTKARGYYSQLLALSEKADTERSELQQAKAFLGR
ncbi:MAG: hypothetical protein HY727_09470 [Candidatus Rokubacteria bacterium]|nr:hypothetical protein [Candidatus Rokubacteria bacterium]